MKAQQKVSRSAAAGMSGLLALWAAPYVHAAGTATVQSGDWSTASTWGGGVPTATSSPVTVSAGTIVTASAVNITISGVADYNVLGELDMVNSSITNIRRMNQAGAGGFISLSNSTLTMSAVQSAAITIYVGSGSNYTTGGLASGSNTTIASGGTVTATATTNPINGANVFITGGTFNTPTLTGNPSVNLNGGKLVDILVDSGDSRSMTSWTGGEYVDNGGQWQFGNASTFFGRMATAGFENQNVLTLSNTGKRTFTAVSSSSAYSISAGTVQFSVYSNTANDNDKLGHLASSTGVDYRVSSNVHFKLLGSALAGDPLSYVGESYLLVDDQVAGSAATMAPILDATIWNIGGSLYNVGLTGSTDGTGSYSVTVVSVTPAPEPGSLVLGGLGIVGFALQRPSRRRSGRTLSRFPKQPF